MRLIKEFNRAYESFWEHKKAVFDEEEEKYRRLEFDKYLKQYNNHVKLFTSKCLTTPSEIDATLKGASKTAQMKIIKEQFDISVHWAGWKDARVVYSSGKVAFRVKYLRDKLKDLLRNYLNPEKTSQCQGTGADTIGIVMGKDNACSRGWLIWYCCIEGERFGWWAGND